MIHPRMDIPACTAAYFSLNMSNLTLQVIGSCKTQFIPPVIILQLWKTMPFTFGYILTHFISINTSAHQESGHSTPLRQFWKHHSTTLDLMVDF